MRAINRYITTQHDNLSVVTSCEFQITRSIVNQVLNVYVTVQCGNQSFLGMTEMLLMVTDELG